VLQTVLILLSPGKIPTKLRFQHGQHLSGQIPLPTALGKVRLGQVGIKSLFVMGGIEQHPWAVHYFEGIWFYLTQNPAKQSRAGAKALELSSQALPSACFDGRGQTEALNRCK